MVPFNHCTCFTFNQDMSFTNLDWKNLENLEIQNNIKKHLLCVEKWLITMTMLNKVSGVSSVGVISQIFARVTCINNTLAWVKKMAWVVWLKKNGVSQKTVLF